MNYRENANAKRTLRLRPDPGTGAAKITIFATIFGVMTGGLTLGTIQSAFRGDINVVGLVFSACFVAGTFWIVRMAYRAITTAVVIEVDELNVVVSWMRHGKVIRLEKVLREELVDVAVNDQPCSGEDRHWLVIGTRNGDIALSEGLQTGRGGYEAKLRSLCDFLRVPARPT